MIIQPKKAVKNDWKLVFFEKYLDCADKATGGELMVSGKTEVVDL